MSIEKAMEFRDRILSDPELGKRILGCKTVDGDLNLTRLLEAAEDEGFRLEMEDAQACLTQLADLEETQLSEFELELVSAGCISWCVEPNCGNVELNKG